MPQGGPQRNIPTCEGVQDVCRDLMLAAYVSKHEKEMLLTRETSTIWLYLYNNLGFPFVNMFVS